MAASCCSARLISATTIARFSWSFPAVIKFWPRNPPCCPASPSLRN